MSKIRCKFVVPMRASLVVDKTRSHKTAAAVIMPFAVWHNILKKGHLNLPLGLVVEERVITAQI